MTTVDLVPLLGGSILLTNRFELRPPGPLATERTLLAQALRVRRHWAPVPAVLLRHPTAGDVLVDTAYAPDAGSDPARTMGRSSAILVRHDPRPLRPQLAALGAEPGTVVMTHLHTDHASGLGEFPDAELVCDRVEWDAGTNGTWLHGYHPPAFAGHAKRRLVDLDAGERHGPFARTFDLFGDGSVRLVATRGHSAGHCSVLVRTPEREVLLCADACGAERQLHELVPSTIFLDRGTFLASLETIQAWHRATPGGLAVPGHDPRWAAWLESAGATPPPPDAS